MGKQSSEAQNKFIGIMVIKFVYIRKLLYLNFNQTFFCNSCHRTGICILINQS